MKELFNDLFLYGMAITHVSDEGTRRTHPMSEEADEVLSKLEKYESDKDSRERFSPTLEG